MSDTFTRSCEHWSEKSRKEMEAFYTLASVDYRYIAESYNWKKWLEALQADIGKRRLKLLDVACGSGKFPSALCQYAGITDANISSIEYALLDPSAFSIAETREVLSPPFIPSTEFETTLQAFSCARDTFDIIWATHALYAVPQNDLECAIDRFIFGMGKVGFIAHASYRSHYLQFYQRYINGFKGGLGEQYSSAEQIIQALKKLGVSHTVKTISYENCASKSSFSKVEGYLQRCIFDDTVNLQDMLNNQITGPYLENCLQQGKWRFKQEVVMIFLSKN